MIGRSIARIEDGNNSNDGDDSKKMDNSATKQNGDNSAANPKKG